VDGVVVAVGLVGLSEGFLRGVDGGMDMLAGRKVEI
jgi:hypothetical protein